MAIGTQAATPSRALSGIALMVGAVCVFSGLDSTAKLMVAYLPAPVVVLFRYAFAAIIVAAVVWRAGGRTLLATTHLRLHLLRGALLLGCTAFNFLAVNYLRLDQTSALMFSTPLFVCALSVPLLGERVGPHRWLAVIAGFIGVLIIIRPGTDGFHWAMLASLMVALCGALYQIATRHVGHRDHALTSLFYVSAAGTVFATPLTALGWQMPEGWQWLALCAMGVLGFARPPAPDRGASPRARAGACALCLCPDHPDEHPRLPRVRQRPRRLDAGGRRRRHRLRPLRVLP
jgi:drug/metabolite transporter (DMT)-like permease